MFIKKYIIPLHIMLLMACAADTDKNGKVLNTPVKGKMTLAADTTLFPLVDALEDMFNFHYKEATVSTSYMSEEMAIRQMILDSFPMIIIGRELNAEEIALCKKRPVTPVQSIICYDAVTLLVNPRNPDSLITYEQLLKVMRGEISTWGELSGKANKNSIKIVFDDANSGTVSHVKRKAGISQLPKNSFATNSNAAAMEYVATHPDALGVISWSWLSDSDDPLSKRMDKKINIVGLGTRDSTSNQMQYSRPWQISLAQNQYPLKREVYSISCEGRTGLASGFMSFATSEIGQLLMLKAGVMPLRQSGRLIQMADK